MVVDSSVVLKWFLTDEDHTVRALDILYRFSKKEIKLAAPTVLIYEVLNGFFAASLSKRYSKEILILESEKFLKLEIDYPPPHANILGYAIETGLSAYDASYLELAKRIDKPLITADKRLHAATVKLGGKVMFIKDWPM